MRRRRRCKMANNWQNGRNVEPQALPEREKQWMDGGMGIHGYVQSHTSAKHCAGGAHGKDDIWRRRHRGMQKKTAPKAPDFLKNDPSHAGDRSEMDSAYRKNWPLPIKSWPVWAGCTTGGTADTPVVGGVPEGGHAIGPRHAAASVGCMGKSLDSFQSELMTGSTRCLSQAK
eukprot:gene24355-biopygen17910